MTVLFQVELHIFTGYFKRIFYSAKLAISCKLESYHCLKFSKVKALAFKNQCNWTPLLYSFKTYVYRNMGSLHILPATLL